MIAFHVRWHLANPLRGIGMEDDFLVVAQLADLRDLIDHADLIVGPHDADQDGVWTNGRSNHVGGDHAIGTRRQEGDIEALALQALARIEHCLVFMDR